jgi:hypothetical protein
MEASSDANPQTQNSGETLERAEDTEILNQKAPVYRYLNIFTVIEACAVKK